MFEKGFETSMLGRIYLTAHVFIDSGMYLTLAKEQRLEVTMVTELVKPTSGRFVF